MEFFVWFFEAIARRAPFSLQIESVRYLTGSVGVFLLIWIIFERPLHNRKIREPTPRLRQIRRELVYSGSTIIVFMLMGVFLYEGAAKGFFKFYTEIDEYGWPYLLGSVVSLAIFHDAYFYWSHRLIHHPRLFRFFHITHHQSRNPTPFTAYAFDPAEAAVNFMVMPLYAFLVPLHDVTAMIYMWLMIVRNAAGHCGYELMPAGWVRHPFFGLFTTITHHDMHHERMTGNYGLYFTWWDRLMGTEHKDYMVRFDKIAGQGGVVQDNT